MNEFLNLFLQNMFIIEEEYNMELSQYSNFVKNLILMFKTIFPQILKCGAFFLNYRQINTESMYETKLLPLKYTSWFNSSIFFHRNSAGSKLLALYLTLYCNAKVNVHKTLQRGISLLCILLNFQEQFIFSYNKPYKVFTTSTYLKF